MTASTRAPVRLDLERWVVARQRGWFGRAASFTVADAVAGTGRSDTQVREHIDRLVAEGRLVNVDGPPLQFRPAIDGRVIVWRRPGQGWARRWVGRR